VTDPGSQPPSRGRLFCAQIKARSCAQRVFFKLHLNGTGVPEIVGRVWSDPMRKIISRLDEQQREALGEFGTAVFSAGLVVAALKGFVDLVM